MNRLGNSVVVCYDPWVILLSVMVNFICEPEMAIRCPDMRLNFMVGMSLRAFSVRLTFSW